MNLFASAIISAFLTGFSPNSQNVSAALNINTAETTQLNPISFISKYEYDSNSLAVNAGFRISKDEFDFTAQGNLYPLQFAKVKIGVLTRYHFRNENDNYNQHDIFAGFDFVFLPLSWFKINASICYFSNWNEIIPLRKYGTEWYHNNSHYACLKLIFIPSKWFDIYASVSNCEYFYYSLIGSASFSIGTDISFPGGILIGLQVDSRWTDIITLSARHDGTDVKVSVGYRW